MNIFVCFIYYQVDLSPRLGRAALQLIVLLLNQLPQRHPNKHLW